MDGVARCVRVPAASHRRRQPRHNEIDGPDELAPARSLGFVRVVLERVDRLAARLSRGPHVDLRGPIPIHVTRNVALSATEATEMVNRRRSIGVSVMVGR